MQHTVSWWVIKLTFFIFILIFNVHPMWIWNRYQLFLEYRGYGLSTGAPSEKGIYIDARAAVDYLFTRHDVDHSQIVLFGRSLGGAVVSDEYFNIEFHWWHLTSLLQVIDVAADSNYGSKVMCSIVENTFTSIPQMASTLISYVKYIPLFCHKNRVGICLDMYECLHESIHPSSAQLN